MALFDFGTYRGKQAAELADISHKLAARTSVDAIPGIDVGSVAAKLFSNPAISGTTDARGGIPEGWREVPPQEMGYSADQIGYNSFIKVNSPVLGDVDGAVQFKVFQSEDGRLAISWAGTNHPVDIIDFSKLNSGEAGPLMDKALTVLANYARSQGIDASDVIVTGYSLGGAYTTIMAQNQATLAGGFFSKAAYISHDGPIVTDGIDNLFHFGFENDIVYRAAGNFATIQEALKAGGPLLEGSDFNFLSSADNVIIYDGAFNNPLFPFGPFSLLNFAGGWYGHISGMLTDAIQRIGNSAFYDLTNRDSAVIVSSLGADLRPLTWVEDRSTSASSDHFGRSAFLIGTLMDDQLRDGRANDFLDGMAGNDVIRVSSGYDLAEGGAGVDTLRLRGDAADWHVFQLQDGSLAFHSTTGDGLKIVSGFEVIQFEGLSLGNVSNVNHAYTIGNDGLRYDGSWFARLFHADVAFSTAVQGTDANDTLSGQTVFGLAGNDTLTGTDGDDLLAGGFGRDVLRGGAGNDQLYGGAHNDVLIAGDGNDRLNGGHGTDVFIFRESDSGHKVIEDFGQAMGETDILAIEGFNSLEALRAAATQHGDTLRIEAGNLVIDLLGTTIDDLTVSNTHLTGDLLL